MKSQSITPNSNLIKMIDDMIAEEEEKKDIINRKLAALDKPSKVIGSIEDNVKILKENTGEGYEVHFNCLPSKVADYHIALTDDYFLSVMTDCKRVYRNIEGYTIVMKIGMH